MSDHGPEEHGGAHEPSPTIYPLGFAVGIAVILVGLVVDPLLIGGIGALITIVFGFLWIREATREYRVEHAKVEAETAEGRPRKPESELTTKERFPRSRFLETVTVGVGAIIGGLVTLPVAGFAVLPSFLGQKRYKVDLGPITEFPESQWRIATFMVNPAEGEVSRRTAFVRNNGSVKVEGSARMVPSFTIISNRCAHLGCPVQANGPIGKPSEEKTANGEVRLIPTTPAGFGCPCHGGQYDTEGNRTAGPPVRALDRYAFEIDNGRLILLNTFSVSHVDGTGAQAQIHSYKLAGPGQHVDGPEQWFYPIQPPHR
ncbi:MAG TPA: Rieske 2Fe-2S domain-containing protein [Gaiellaceae bacterium]|nr:Rieske 2Fe-2S domain-containing protein [Gaiellaceae bacterium]